MFTIGRRVGSLVWIPAHNDLHGQCQVLKAAGITVDRRIQHNRREPPSQRPRLVIKQI